MNDRARPASGSGFRGLRRPARAIGAVVLALVLAMVVGGCASGGAIGITATSSQSPGVQPIATGGASEPSVDTGAAIDVCALVTSAEFTAKTTFKVKSQEADTGGGLARGPGCVWVLDTGSDMDLAGIHSIAINVLRPGGRAAFDLLAGLLAVQGLGDGAVESGGNAGGDVWAVKGDTQVHLQYALPVDTVDADPLVLPLVSLVLSRI